MHEEDKFEAEMLKKAISDRFMIHHVQHDEEENVSVVL